MSVTERIALLCVETLPGRIGAAELANARLCLIDSLAVAMAASQSPEIELLCDAMEIGGAIGSSGLIGRGVRARADDAALVNGMMISLLLFDDNHSTMRGHPSGPVWPAVLALAQRLDVSLDAALRAFVVGYEMETRLGPVFNPSQYEVGWHATATQGTFGATAASSVLLGLSAPQTAVAFGIAASLLGGARRNFGTMTMSFHSGLAASAGVRAALLARGGFSADPSIFDGAMGIGELLSREWRPEALAASLEVWGAPFEIVDAGPVFKLFACGRPVLAPLEAALQIQGRPGFDPAAISAITAEVSYMYPRTLIHAAPATGLQSKTSLQYTLASALLRGRPTMATYTDAAVADPAVEAMRQKVRVVVPAHLSEAVAEVRRLPFDQKTTIRVEMNDGTCHSATVQFAKGMPQNPVGAADLYAKFADCAGEGLAERLRGLLGRSDATAEDLMHLMASGAAL
jgi:2-methylcitrate dehydratase PrpD